MNNAQATLLELMKKAIAGEYMTALPEEAVDWAAAWEEARAQTVSVLFYDTLQPVLPQIFSQHPQLERQMHFALVAMGKNIYAEDAQREAIEVVEKLGCPYVILKGTTSSAYYPAPPLRQLGDLDLLIPADQTEVVRQAMLACGYQAVDKFNPHHSTVSRNGFFVELHNQPGGIPEGNAREPICKFLQDIFSSRQLLQTPAGSFYAPSLKHHALVMILHMLYHIEEYGFGLRQVMDWACFVKQTVTQDFWPELLELLEQTGLLRLTAAVTKMSHLYLGTPCPDWAQDVPQALCRELMEDIMSGGNFGRKDPDRARSATMLPDWETQKSTGKLQRMFQVLRHYILLEKPELKNKPVVLFFHMGYRCCRFVVLYALGKRPNLIRAAGIAEKRKSVYAQLRLYQTEN